MTLELGLTGLKMSLRYCLDRLPKLPGLTYSDPVVRLQIKFRESKVEWNRIRDVSGDDIVDLLQLHSQDLMALAIFSVAMAVGVIHLSSSPTSHIGADASDPVSFLRISLPRYSHGPL